MTEYPAHPVDLGWYVVRSKEKEFGVLVVESDGASSKERENSRNGEDGIKGCSINVGVLSDNRGPVEEAVS